MPRTRASLSVEEIRERIVIMQTDNEGEEETEAQKALRASPDPYDEIPLEWFMSPEVEEPAGQQDILPTGDIRVRLGRGMQPAIIPRIAHAPIEDNFNTAFLRVEWNEAVRLWKGSKCRETVADAVKEYVAKTGWTCNFAICLGVGSLTRGNKQVRKRNLYQMAAFIDVVMLLQPTDDRRAMIPVVYQELAPTITQMDREFLLTLDVEVLEVLPTPDDSRITVGGYDRERTLDRGAFIFEAGVDG